MKYKINEKGKNYTLVEDGVLELCTIYGSDSKKVAKRIVNALHLLDTVEKGTQAEVKKLITEIKKK